MVFTSALLVPALLIASASALPSREERHAARIARRALGHQSNPADRLDLGGGVVAEKIAVNSTVGHVQYSSNWAGAVYTSYPAGSFKSVTGTFTVPTPKEPSGGSGAHYASAWVGIDGDTCGTAILQTGLDFEISGSGVAFDAWYEWYPDYAYDFSGISFSPGDSVTVTVTAATTKSGTAVIKNNSKGQTVTKSITSSAALCEQNAEWIVEDFSSSGGLVPFANFGTVTFTGASATTSSGTVSAGSASLIDIKQGSKVYTSSSVSGSTVTIKYVG